MNNNLTEIEFILDRSGSMGGLTDDTIGGYNAFIESQKNEPGDAVLTTVLFDHEYTVLHNGVNLKDVKPMTYAEYMPRGMTALYDAIGKTINDVGRRLNNTPEAERPGKVIFVITTDGYENASKEFTQQQVKEMIEHQTDKYSWQFMFLGANIDVQEVSCNLGISADFAASYTASENGVESVYSTMSKTVAGYRDTGAVSMNWMDSLV